MLFTGYATGGLLAGLIGFVIGVVRCSDSCDESGWREDPRSRVFDVLELGATVMVAAVLATLILASLGQRRWAMVGWGVSAAAGVVVAGVASAFDEGNPAAPVVTVGALFLGLMALRGSGRDDVSA